MIEISKRLEQNIQDAIAESQLLLKRKQQNNKRMAKVVCELNMVQYEETAGGNLTVHYNGLTGTYYPKGGKYTLSNGCSGYRVFTMLADLGVRDVLGIDYTTGRPILYQF